MAKGEIVAGCLAPHPENQIMKNIAPGVAKPRVYSNQREALSLTKMK